MRIETGDGWELRLGSCLEPGGLDSLETVDHYISDPPYDERINTNSRSVGKATGPKSQPRYLDVGGKPDAQTLLAHAHRITKRWIFNFCADFNLHEWMDSPEGLEYIRTIFWVKTVTTPQISGDRPAHAVEVAALHHAKGRKRWNGGGKYGAYHHPQCMGRSRPNHPTPKPLPLMLEIVRDFTDAGDLICDPFTGSGTTALAAIGLGRRFIGWELREDYFDEAVARLRIAEKQITLFVPEVGKGKQAKIAW